MGMQDEFKDKANEAEQQARKRSGQGRDDMRGREQHTPRTPREEREQAERERRREAGCPHVWKVPRSCVRGAACLCVNVSAWRQLRARAVRDVVVVRWRCRRLGGQEGQGQLDRVGQLGVAALRPVQGGAQDR